LAVCVFDGKIESTGFYVLKEKYPDKTIKGNGGQ
jgi:hypothetical protein